MIANERLTEIEKTANKATPGPWAVDKYGDVVLAYGRRDDVFSLCATVADSEFAALARFAVPELLEEIERLREEVTYWIKKHDALLSDSTPPFENVSDMLRRAKRFEP